ncbi:ATP phosphoribosyltransferase regulatory subunit [Oceanobacillus iheyensis]|uniref:ATP phosphoribosyltransferase regulatory subunit n=1 Tax=Oceanobacillus iheyensis (strain DSM 14371 / CIP 107618 / JCM 11309 / KCTC 3954 / HTE831) TaxID=221109 RepID=HISZ_OCEIH|nr:ATP phosphoribosyltransferase regulatory subunit [Oceanobacillus iheyensis]Q8CXM7.1 RecName: Full=ATP phosphoribosyltransferase regulatory subunit [Oceanobacillus iheyensis HTE831]BAC12509.1 histidine-tRNA ligase (histidyl-tRNA synthetase) [Oceanobacillus iheyensis HTE831]
MINYNFRNRTSFPEDFLKKANVIKQIQNRFYTYGYDQIETPLFEDYDMYSNVQGTVQQDDMVKVIHSSGRVLVLRPDVTIPITRQYVETDMTSHYQRFSYCLDIFRFNETQQAYRTQAGVEFFGDESPEADAEVIALAIDSLKDLKIAPFKIEIGHSGIYKELLEQANLTDQEQQTLHALIQSKNISETSSFLDHLSIDQDLKQKIELIPMLYGDPSTVIKRAQAIVTNETMQQVVDTLFNVYSLLKDDQIEEYISFNLGLINNMNYYSGIIFQGFTEQIGQPILMGGRYDHLSSQFENEIPAVGFAFEIDKLLTLITPGDQPLITQADFLIEYQPNCRQDALLLARRLRQANKKVIIQPTESSSKIKASNIILVDSNSYQLKSSDIQTTFSSIDQTLQHVLKKR